MPSASTRPARSRPATSYDRLEYVRLRAPQGDRQTLETLPGTEIRKSLDSNLQLAAQPDRQSIDVFRDGQTLAQHQQQARQQVVRAAAEWTGRYLPAAHDQYASVPLDKIVMSGHQPALFHPGVWYKNFRLNAVASHAGAIPINLVVDNDLCTASVLPVPVLPDPNHEQPAMTKRLRMDVAGRAIAFENRSIIDRNRFERFQSVVAEAISPIVANPIIEPLWPEVLAAADLMGGQSLGQVLAAGRQRLEWRHGVKNLEVPISALANTPSFAAMAQAIFQDLAGFQTIYNDVVRRYRDRHGIRSNAHPVPDLGQSGRLLEAPFWVWSRDNPFRRPLFVEKSNDRLMLTDLNDLRIQIDIKDLGAYLTSQANICLRPRALTTTMYCRLLLSDLFIHGIGGAKYDQLTDQIAWEFFGVDLPRYATSTATFHLPVNSRRVTKTMITEQEHRLRQLRFHPESAIAQPSEQALQWITQKRAAIFEPRDDWSKRDRHRLIEESNMQLQTDVAGLRLAAQQDLLAFKSQFHDSQVLHSREYSFCLHPISIIDRLKSLAAVKE